MKRARKTSAAGLVNAVLRKVSSAPAGQILPSEQSLLLAHPAWLLERWARQYGAETAAAVAESNNEPPPVFARTVDTSHGRPCRYVRNCRELTGVPHRIAREYVLQDEGSQIVPHLLAPEDRHHVLDVCAAPGMKTGALLEMAPSATVVAADISMARLRMVHMLAGPGSHRVVLDGTRPLPFAASFDRVLLDAPCSGTGTVRRNPEIKWRLRESQLAEFAGRQRQMLRTSLDVLKPGGRLVYSTCSIEREENEDVVELVLAEKPSLELLPVSSLSADFLHDEGKPLLGGKYLRTLPNQGLDGFFAAVFCRRRA